MPDYKQGKIYSIRSYKTDKVYIGSTTQPLHKRLYEHKRHYNRWLNGKYGCNSCYEIIKYGDAYIELVEYFDCKSKNELEKREGEIIRSIDCVNKMIAGRDKK